MRSFLAEHAVRIVCLSTSSASCAWEQLSMIKALVKALELCLQVEVWASTAKRQGKRGLIDFMQIKPYRTPAICSVMPVLRLHGRV